MLIEKIIKKVKIKFQNDQKRLNHILGVHRISIKLSRFYKENMFQTQVAALWHDYTKNEPLEFHISHLTPKIIKKYQFTPHIYHAFSTAVILQEEFKIDDIKILNALRKHVWGHKIMNKLDKIILLSDKIEPQRNYTQVDYFRKLAFIDLNQAVYELLDFNYNFHKKKGKIIHKEQQEILSTLKNKIRKK
ncbi:bis(5'-nucleosyl)-tetraphosphatase (symmetrical) YqeK [Candidatus Phytoplasma prunorum]|uniref:bis(5'-nucleosyl)-tetraphosphatase (symmetrical) YqeK n=1 Tax=Candidatus Phytoplasma prunorum TaxID=47565 RepID=UPI002FF13B2C